MLRDSMDNARIALWERSRLWPLWGGGADVGRVFWLSERSGERLKSQHRHCITERSEFGKAGGLTVGAPQRASIFRFHSAHKGKSSASQRMRRWRMSCWAFGSEAWLPSLKIYQRTDVRKLADTFLPIDVIPKK